MSPAAHALEIDGVTKEYGEFVAVDDLSFSVKSGLVYGVLGPNGAGKTTTLRMLNDILAPDRGTIRLFGELSPGIEAGRRIGYLPEERGLYPKMRIGEVLEFFGRLRGLRGRDARKRAKKWLERLGIDEWIDHRVQDLSKGMQQKVQFASALLHDPELLILDEPWSGLDPINAEVLKEIVREQKAAGKTVLFSTHLMEQAEQICDSVCIIARGRMAVEGPLGQIKAESTADRIVALDFEDESARLRATETALCDVSVVAQVKECKDWLEVELADGASSQQLLQALVSADVALARFERMQPTLHQIFVDQVGANSGANIEDRTTGAR